MKRSVQVSDDDADFIQTALEAKNSRVNELKLEMANAEIKYRTRIFKIIRKYGLDVLPSDFDCPLTDDKGAPIRPCVFTYDDGTTPDGKEAKKS